MRKVQLIASVTFRAGEKLSSTKKEQRCLHVFTFSIQKTNEAACQQDAYQSLIVEFGQYRINRSYFVRQEGGAK